MKKRTSRLYNNGQRQTYIHIQDQKTSRQDVFKLNAASVQKCTHCKSVTGPRGYKSYEPRRANKGDMRHRGRLFASFNMSKALVYLIYCWPVCGRVRQTLPEQRSHPAFQVLGNGISVFRLSDSKHELCVSQPAVTIKMGPGYFSCSLRICGQVLASTRHWA